MVECHAAPLAGGVDNRKMDLSPRKRHAGSYCSAVSCSNRQSIQTDLHYFRFPKDSDRAKRWVINCKREDLLKKTPEYLYANCRLCSEHFEEDSFMNATERNSLRKDAIPTIFSFLKRKLKRKVATKRQSSGIINQRSSLSSSLFPDSSCLPKDLRLHHVDHNYASFMGSIPEESTSRTVTSTNSSLSSALNSKPLAQVAASMAQVLQCQIKPPINHQSSQVKTHYRSCFVPMCKSTSISTPGKVFLSVPRKLNAKRSWFVAARKPLPLLMSNSSYYCCEDHFNLKEDMENYMYYSMMGGYIKLKPGVMPHKFDCQGEVTPQNLNIIGLQNTKKVLGLTRKKVPEAFPSKENIIECDQTDPSSQSDPEDQRKEHATDPLSQSYLEDQRKKCYGYDEPEPLVPSTRDIGINTFSASISSDVPVKRSARLRNRFHQKFVNTIVDRSEKIGGSSSSVKKGNVATKMSVPHIIMEGS